MIDLISLVARLAIDVITFDSSVERAIKYVVGNALISDSTEVGTFFFISIYVDSLPLSLSLLKQSLFLAKHIVYDKHQQVKVVTLDGTVLHKTGMITGGQSEGGASQAQRWEQRDVDGSLKRVTKYRLDSTEGCIANAIG